MSKYLTLPRITVKGVNAQPAWWLIAPPGPMTFLGFAQALGRHLGLKNPHIGVAIIWHNWDLRAESVEGRILPHQFRSASLINQDDYAQGSRTLAGQPSARGDGCLSLVVQIDDDESIDPKGVSEFLALGRIAGGTIESHRYHAKRALLHDSYADALRVVRAGFGFVDRSDLIKDGAGKDPLDRFLNATHPGKKGEDSSDKESWLIPYASAWYFISEPAQRSSTREGMEHAFVEPMVTIGQMISMRQSEPALWRMQRIDERTVGAIATQSLTEGGA